MKYILLIKEEAEEDIQAAYAWYEEQLEGLGERFISELDNSFSAIKKNPFIFEVKYKNEIRFLILNTFPYVALYTVQRDEIIVFALFSTHQNPKLWKKRLK